MKKAIFLLALILLAVFPAVAAMTFTDTGYAAARSLGEAGAFLLINLMLALLFMAALLLLAMSKLVSPSFEKYLFAAEAIWIPRVRDKFARWFELSEKREPQAAF